MAKKTCLVITDGIGFKPRTTCNAFFKANTPTYDYLFENVPTSMIHTHGMFVGLPEGQMGNSEVGHMAIGAGRVLYQDLVKISMALDDGSLANNEALVELMDKSERIHIAGLMSDGGVHSHLGHILGLAKLIASKGKKVFLHMITDGRDVSPTSSPEYIAQVNEVLDDNITFASISGRFYAMDRDKRWERVERGYRAMAEATPKTDMRPLDYVQSMYKQDITDEFIEPTAFEGFDGIMAGDGFIMANFRSDRAREISTAIADKNFKEFEKKTDCCSVHLITMTEYDKSFDFPVMFRKEDVTQTLAETISKAGLNQMHTAETEKYAHVTFFLNGGREEPFENETRILVPSPKVKTYDLQPEMSAVEVCDAVLKTMDENMDFIVVNFANGDMVGHTGIVEAGIKAAETVDTQLGRIIEKARASGWQLLITADHGNLEEMCDCAGNVLTNHTVGDVYCHIIAEGVTNIKDGALNNIAPTLLKMMGLEIPDVMDAPLY